MINTRNNILTSEQIDTIVENEYLGLSQDFDDSNIYNIFMDTQHQNLFNNNPVLELMDIFSNPDYFYFTCKHLLNIRLLPFQAAILKQLWTKKFPMLVASRGASKSFLLSIYAILRALLTNNIKVIIVSAGFRQSKIMFEYMEKVWRSSPILRHIVGGGKKEGPHREIDRCTFYVGGSEILALPLGSGEKIRGVRSNFTLCDEFSCLVPSTIIQTDKGLIRISDFLNGKDSHLMNAKGNFEYPDYVFRTPKTDVYHIVTQNGYSFKCSNIHQVMTINGWKLAKDLTTDDFLELDCNDYFPSEYIKDNGFILDENMGWLMGLLTSEGTMTNRNFIEITNTDKDLIDEIQEKIKLPWKLRSREAKMDPRGWKCRKSYSLVYGDVPLRTVLAKWGMDYVTSHNKEIPSGILQSPRTVIIEFLRGLFTGDGTCFQYTRDGKKNVGIAYYSVNEELINTLQILLLKFGITCTKGVRDSKISKNPQFMLAMRAENAVKIYNLLKIKKWEKVVEGCAFFKRTIYIRPNGNRLVVQTTRANKNVHLGTYDTKEECEKAFYEYWKNIKPCFRVKSVKKLDEQQVLYDFHMPKEHSFLGNGFIQHNSIPVDIFETVIKGFSSVSSMPEEKVKNEARITVLKSLGMYSEATDLESQSGFGNQIVISGTAYYHFNHFYEYWKRYKTIIESKGDKNKLEEVFKGEVPDGFDWKQYCVMRLPYTILPKGFMDIQQIYQAKATNKLSYWMEYCALFSSDSNGFFKRSLIESCVTKNPINLPSGPVRFSAATKGRRECKYVYGIDPASEKDNFAIVILEVYPDHRRIVYSWTVSRDKMRDHLTALNADKSQSFYNYCAAKIRSLMKDFPTEHIGIDSQGGGIAVMEALHEKSLLEDGQLPLWPYTKRSYDNFWWEQENKPTDNEAGQHFLHMVNFASAEFTVEANHGMRRDFESKILLFPYFDSVTIAESIELDKLYKREYDTLEDCCLEIEELKDELATIVHDQTSNGRDRWSTPEIKTPGGKKGRLRKDRYTALLIANMVARNMVEQEQPEYQCIGTYVSAGKKKKDSSNQPMYVGNNAITTKLNQFKGFAVQRR